MKLKFYEENHRGVHAAEDITLDDTILFVPDEYLISLEDIWKTSLGKKMKEAKIELEAKCKRHIYFAAWLLQEKKMMTRVANKQVMNQDDKAGK